MQDFRNLKVWQKAHQLTLRIYVATNAFPAHEQFGLTSQMRRSAASIPTNLAEGCGRYGDAELVRFAQIAMGSASELEYQLLLSHDLSYLSAEDHDLLHRQVVELKRMLASLISRLRADARGRPNGRESGNSEHTTDRRGSRRLTKADQLKD